MRGSSCLEHEVFVVVVEREVADWFELVERAEVACVPVEFVGALDLAHPRGRVHNERGEHGEAAEIQDAVVEREASDGFLVGEGAGVDEGGSFAEGAVGLAAPEKGDEP